MFEICNPGFIFPLPPKKQLPENIFASKIPDWGKSKYKRSLDNESIPFPQGQNARCIITCNSYDQITLAMYVHSDILLQLVRLSPRTHLVKNLESQSTRLN